MNKMRERELVVNSASAEILSLSVHPFSNQACMFRHSSFL